MFIHTICIYIYLNLQQFLPKLSKKTVPVYRRKEKMKRKKKD